MIKVHFETKSSVTAIRMMQKKYPEDDRLKASSTLARKYGSVEDS